MHEVTHGGLPAADPAFGAVQGYAVGQDESRVRWTSCLLFLVAEAPSEVGPQQGEDRVQDPGRGPAPQGQFVIDERTIAGLATHRDGNEKDRDKPPPKFQPGFQFGGPANVKFFAAETTNR